MLQNADDTLTNSQISEFILDRGYTNYFHLQQALSELVEAELVNKDTRSNTSHYQVTEDGRRELLKRETRGFWDLATTIQIQSARAT